MNIDCVVAVFLTTFNASQLQLLEALPQEYGRHNHCPTYISPPAITLNLTKCPLQVQLAHSSTRQLCCPTPGTKYVKYLKNTNTVNILFPL